MRADQGPQLALEGLITFADLLNPHLAFWTLGPTKRFEEQLVELPGSIHGLPPFGS